MMNDLRSVTPTPPTSPSSPTHDSRRSDGGAMTIAASEKGQTSLPRLDSESSVTLTHRRQALKREGQPAMPDLKSNEVRAELPPKASSKSGSDLLYAIKTVAKLYAGAAGLYTAYQGMKNPRDFIEHPDKAIIGSMIFSSRTDEGVISRANNTVLSRFGHAISDNNACYKSTAEVSFDLPWYEGGRYTTPVPKGEPGKLKVNAFQQLGGDANHAANHEFVHCYTHPDFMQAAKTSHLFLPLIEGITENQADKLPNQLPWWSQGGIQASYHTAQLPNGKSWTDAAGELEQNVGEATLQKALFSGDKTAMAKVSDAAAQVYPKAFATQTWQSIGKVAWNAGSQQLAECYLGSLTANKATLPKVASWAYLPVSSIGDIPTKAFKDMKQQAEACRQRLGEDIFDAAFYGFDVDRQRELMKVVREDVKLHWKPVLEYAAIP